MKERATVVKKSRRRLTPGGISLRLLLLLLLVLVVRHWVWMPVLITGVSMLPTLRDGQFAGVNKLAYLFRPPRRGDIVVFWTGKDLMTKRIVGLPGEEIGARHGTLYVNESPLQEPYALKWPWWTAAPGKLGANSYLVLGDNRLDSMSAVVNRGRIVGRVCLLHRPGPAAMPAAGSDAPPPPGRVGSGAGQCGQR